MREQFAPFGGEGFGPGDIDIKFVGRARARDLSEEDSLAEGQVGNSGGRRSSSDENRRARTWRLFNPGTQNEFEIVVPEKVRRSISSVMDVRGATQPTRGTVGTSDGDSAERTPPAPTLSVDGAAGDLPVQPAAWSGGVDDRQRISPVTTWPWRTIADLGGCTATLVGPRHAITAGHCLYSRTTASWGNGFNVRPERDANSVPFSSVVPDPAGRESWMFTPVGWRDPNPSGGEEQYDLGILVIPDRLGDTLGHMGYGTLGSNDLKARTHLLRGYPFCESETTGSATNPERIDEPNPCVVNGFYGGSSCTVDSFSKTDPQNWSRRVTHSCDASAANSGSSLYTYVNGDPWVTMIHTKSLRCAFVGQSPCAASDTYPLEATRLTPEYTGWVTYFRSLFP